VRNASKPRQQEALAVAEDRAGQEVLRAAERAEDFRRYTQTDRYKHSRSPNPCAEIILSAPQKCSLGTCRTEDEHDFTSYGQCRRCGAHRKPS